MNNDNYVKVLVLREDGNRLTTKGDHHFPFCSQDPTSAREAFRQAVELWNSLPGEDIPLAKMSVYRQVSGLSELMGLEPICGPPA